MKHFNPQKPIVVGLTGKAGSGKTSTADTIVPQSRGTANFVVPQVNGNHDQFIESLPDSYSNYETYDHLYFAMPLYKMVSTRRGTEGAYQKDRTRYTVHDILLDVFGHSPLFGAPKYHELVDLVETIVAAPLSSDGKPRKFLQDVGSAMRSLNKECFVQWAKRQTYNLHRQHVAELRQAYIEEIVTMYEDGDFNEQVVQNNSPLVVIWSDVRYPNEAEFIHKEPNGILIKLEASFETRKQRIISRDGFLTLADEEALHHESEKSVDLIPEEWFTKIISTETITLPQQAWAVIETVREFTYAARS